MSKPDETDHVNKELSLVHLRATVEHFVAFR